MIQIDCAEVKKIAPDVILTIFKDRYEVELADVIQLNEIYIDLASGNQMFSIIDAEKSFSHFSTESLNYLSNDAPFVVEHNLMRGSVVVVRSLAGRLIANFFVRLKKHKYPLKVVSTLKDGVSWIESKRIEA